MNAGALKLPPLPYNPKMLRWAREWRKHGPCRLGQLVRACNFQDRTAARRVLKDLRKMGEI